MDIAKKQVEYEAHVLGINVENDLLDGLAGMQKFVKFAVAEAQLEVVVLAVHPTLHYTINIINNHSIKK